jgi:predicted ATP-grasp superfamily ATP-dependent carboligase
VSRLREAVVRPFPFPMPLPTVLVTDPEQRAALATVRALGQHGHRVYVIGRSAGIAGRSRYVQGVCTVASEVPSNSSQMVEAVAREVHARGIDVVVPVTDTASRALLGCDSLIGAAVAGPSRDAYERASDKRALLEAAPSCGIRVPRQVTMQRPGDDFAAARGFRALVIKPSHSVVEVDGKSVGTRVRFVDAPSELGAAIATFPAAAYPLLLQERVMGMGVGVFLLRTGGVTSLVFGHRRVREKPPAGGVSTCRESVVPSAALVHACERLLDHLRYEGAAMIEFKEDVATGEHVLMEINARLWGSVQLAVDAGVNFPLAMVQLAMRQAVQAAPSVRSGLRSVWEFGEIDHCLALLRRSREALHLPPEADVGIRGALRAIGDRRRGDQLEVFRWSDPAPFFAEAYRWFRGVT